MDNLITIIPGFNNTNAIKSAYLTAAEFLSALSYDYDSKVSLSYLGGQGIRIDFKLRSARMNVYDFRKRSPAGDSSGYDLVRVPKIETEEQKMALTLYREASFIDNRYFKFLFFWQVLEVGKKDPIGWINKVIKSRSKYNIIRNSEVDKIKLNGKSLGNYFYDDCRNAIAHIPQRKPGKTKISLDTPEDNIRFAISSRVISTFAQLYIKEVLELNKYLWLTKSNKDKFPVFTDV